MRRALVLALVVPCLSVGCSSSDSSSQGETSTSTGGGAAGTGGGSAAGGTTGTGGSTGTGGAAGTGGPGGSSAGGASGAGGAATGPICMFGGAPACGAGTYCVTASCGAGTCATPPTTDTSERAPVCGCDGITYWNASVAARFGVSVAKSGECQGPTCGGFASLKCPTGVSCNYRVDTAAVCQASDAGGTCWGMPIDCATGGIGPLERACGAATCAGECALVKMGSIWYPDSTCPQ